MNRTVNSGYMNPRHWLQWIPVTVRLFTMTVEAGANRPIYFEVDRHVAIMTVWSMFVKLLSGVTTGTVSAVRFDDEGIRKVNGTPMMNTTIVKIVLERLAIRSLRERRIALATFVPPTMIAILCVNVTTNVVLTKLFTLATTVPITFLLLRCLIRLTTIVVIRNRVVNLGKH